VAKIWRQIYKRRWAEKVEEDLKNILGIKIWKREAMDRQCGEAI
jgi:hypothetical protein